MKTLWGKNCSRWRNAFRCKKHFYMTLIWQSGKLHSLIRGCSLLGWLVGWFFGTCHIVWVNMRPAPWSAESGFCFLASCAAVRQPGTQRHRCCATCLTQARPCCWQLWGTQGGKPGHSGQQVSPGTTGWGRKENTKMRSMCEWGWSSYPVVGCPGGRAHLAEDGGVEAPQGEVAACCPC